MNNKHTRQQHNLFWTSVLSGFALAIVKVIVGYVAVNKALMGDALYTASGAASSLAERFSKKAGREYTEKLHSASYSRKRSEAFGTGAGAPFSNILIALLLLLGGLEIAISAVRDMMMQVQAEPKPLAIIAVFLTLAVNEGVFRYRYRYAYKHNSPRLSSDIDNHRYSLYVSILVLAGMLSTIAALEMGLDSLYYIQPASAVLVSIILWRQAYRMARQSIYGRLVHTMRQEDAADYTETVQRVQGVITVEQLQAEEHDDGVHIEVSIGVNPHITVQAASEIADYAKDLLLNRFAHVRRVQVQIVPYTGSYPYKSNHEHISNREHSGDGMLH